MKIKTITQIGILLLIVVTVTMGLFVFKTTQKMSRKAHETILAAKTVKDIAELKIVMHEYLMYSEERSLIQWKSKYNLLSKSFIQEENIFDSRDGNILFSKIHQNFLRIGIVFGKLSAELEKRPRDYRQKDYRQKDISFLKFKNRLTGELLVRSQAMVSLVFQLQQIIQTEAALLHQTTISLILAFFMLFAFMVAGILFWINNSVAKPITALEQGIRIIGSGNLNHKIGIDAKNEIGHLSRAFDKMTMDLKRKTTSIDELNKEIFEREKAEKELIGSERKLSTWLDSSPVCTEIVDLDFNLQYMSVAGVNTLNIDDITPFYGKPYPFDFYPESFKNLMTENLKKVKETNKRIEQEGCTIDINGNELWFYSTLIPVNDDKGRIDYFIVISVDITERKKAEEALRKSESRFRTFFKQGLIGMTITSVDKGWIEANDTLCNMLGYSIDELSQMTWAELTHPDDLEADLTQFRRLLAGEINNYSLEKRFIRSDGKIIFTIISVNAMKKTDDNSVDYILATVQDISERKQAEVERTKLENQFQQAQKMESVGRLAGGVAHDFNNALSVIMGTAELAIYDVNTTGQLHENLNEILMAGKRAADITRQLLAFARKQTISPKVLDLNDNIENMLKMLRRLIGEDIDLAWLPGVDPWPVKMDPIQIDQILANLCVNARDAIEGVGKVTIESGNITFNEEYCTDHMGFIPGDFVHLTVSDNGCGMDKEILDNIFEPFFTTKDVDKGTGLGLATVYGIVKQNNGFINVYSELNKGTTIKVYLPRHKTESVEIHEETTEELPTGKGETILVVEDDSAILKIIQKILEGMGYNVLTSGAPEKAMDIVKEYTGKIHLLITDVIMPKMNGRDLAEQLQPICPDLKYIFMSGYTANVIARQGVLDKDVNFIQKPFSREDLAEIVRKVLDENV